MGLMICPDCGFEHSDSAPACPKCGRPNISPTSSATNTTPVVQPAAPSTTVSVTNEGCASGCGKWIFILLLVIIGVPIGILLLSLFLPTVIDTEDKNRETSAATAEQTVLAIFKTASVYTLEEGGIEPVSADCSQYIDIEKYQTGYRYRCEGTEDNFVVTATGDKSNSDSKGIVVKLTGNLSRSEWNVNASGI